VKILCSSGYILFALFIPVSGICAGGNGDWNNDSDACHFYEKAAFMKAEKRKFRRVSAFFKTF